MLDPIVTPSVITRAFGYMIWDTLIAADSKGNLHPQMLESWHASDDQLTYTFKLRPGLVWSDGAPVRSEDCIASLKRWGSRDGVGRQLVAATRDFQVVDDSTFILHLARPFGHVIELLGKTAALVPFMMPARIAATPSTSIITEIVGSGPFTFNRAEWRPGDRVVFRKNMTYKPRPEPADGLSGGKVVHFDRVEFLSMPDLTTRMNALVKGDIDYMERIPPDYIAPLKNDKRIVIMSGRGGGAILALLTLNHLQPPFNNVKLRQALQVAINPKEVIDSLGYAPEMVYPDCLSVYMCGSRYETDAGTERFKKPDMARARELVKASGYKNEPVVVLHSSDSVLIDPITVVAIEHMKQLGLNVDERTTDWSTVAQLRTKKVPTGEGGWSVTPIVWTGFDMMDPLINPALAYNCAEGYPGWWCDERQVPVMAQYLAERDEGQRKELAIKLQVLLHDNVNIVLMGQVAAPGVYRSNLRGVIDIGLPLAWNIQRVEP
ncbi:ABC transporter substrate-binding protein [uncultured Enterovirga sp.]|uniref:ABC transporter substrate-binding protein n=1 Tax=uncultured Enterovirga sp. TaxID=2026352 RepID=UPI0035CC39D4